MRKVVFLLLIVVVFSCQSGAEGRVTADLEYSYQEKGLESVPEVLRSATWMRHLEEDLMPFWLSDVAKGEPVGNFPTEYDKSSNTERYVRMLSRQVYVYSMAFYMTGRIEYYELAQVGYHWIIDHAWDGENGLWYQRLFENGEPVKGRRKFAQDIAYALVGVGAYYFITNDSEAEEYILKSVEMLFDTEKYYNEKLGLLRTSLKEDLRLLDYSVEDVNELVAQLDQINAYMLLTQRVLSDESDRSAMLDKMKGLIDSMIKHYQSDGFFFGDRKAVGNFRGNHTDFGHCLKTYWMILQTDKRFESPEYMDFIGDNAFETLMMAFDNEHGGWASRLLGEDVVGYGSQWWIYTELDQLAATFNMNGVDLTGVLERTASFWLDHYVDYEGYEVYSSVSRSGVAENRAKGNFWKNGFHSIEHALVMYIHGKYLENESVTFYYHLSYGEGDFYPYIFDGSVENVTVNDDVTAVTFNSVF